MSVLTLTVSSPEVALTAGAGTLTVSVTNTGAAAERVVLGVYPPLTHAEPAAGGPPAAAPERSSPSADAAGTPVAVGSAEPWTQVERPLRDVAAGATEQYIVTFAAQDAGPGRYEARFIAYSADKAPEEFADQARTVSIRKEGPPPPVTSPRRRPWWLVALAVALVVVLAVAAFVLFRPKDEPAAPTPAVTTPSPCKPGLVPRLTRPGDNVCVTPASAAQVIVENTKAVQDERKPTPRGGPYGPETCLPGWVWRDAFAGDTVCVAGPTRDRTAQENADAAANAAP